MSIYGIIYGRDVLVSVKYIFDQFTKQNINFRDAKVLIKPNLVAPSLYTTGATTDPALVSAIIQRLKELGSSKICIAESSWVGASTQEAFEVTGYVSLAEKEQITLIDIKKEPWKSKPLNGIINKTITIPKAVEEADYIINVPILKCHSQTILSMGMKNLKGLLPDFEKKRFHLHGLHKCIVDLNSLIKPVITIMDGRCVDLNHEFGGETIELNLMFWGDNNVTLDCIAASFLGYNPQEIEYLSLANSKGLGDPNYDPQRLDFKNLEDNRTIELIEKSVFDKINAERNLQRLKFEGKCQIYDKNACSGCRGPSYFALEKIKKETSLNFNVFIGKPYEIPSERSFAIGNCLRNDFKDENIVLGCPPSSMDIYNKLKKWLDLRMNQ